jgi:hypothetical protein
VDGDEPAPEARLLRFVSRDVDAPSPIVLGAGDSSRFGSLLPYAVDRTVYTVGANGRAGLLWEAPATVVALAAKDGELPSPSLLERSRCSTRGDRSSVTTESHPSRRWRSRGARS